MVGECPISDLSNQIWRRKSSFAMYYVVFEKKQHFFIYSILGEFFFNALLIGRAQCIAPHEVVI